MASAERRLAQDTAHAARAQDQLAASAKKAHTELKAAAAAYRLASTGRGINPLTGGSMERPGVGAVSGIRRAQLLLSIQRSGMAGYADLAGRRAEEGGGGPRRINIGERIGRVFGERLGKLGGMVGEAAEGRLSVGMVAFGAATVGATAIVSGFSAVMKEAIESTRRVAEGQGRLADMTRDYINAANSAAIGEAKRNQTSIASLIASGKYDQGQKAAAGLGPDGLQAVGILNQKRLLDNPRVVEALHKAVDTGMISAVQFASTIGSARGLSGVGSASGIAKAVLAQNGVIGVNVDQAGQRYGQSAFGRAMNRNDAIEEGRSGDLLGRFATGQTQVTANEDRFRAAHPEVAALKDTGRELDEQQKIQDRVVSQMGTWARFWDHLTNTFNGYQNSEDVRGRKLNNERAAIVNP